MPHTMDDFRREYLKDHLKELTPAERLEGLSPEERLQGLSPEEWLKRLSPEERLKSVSPEDIKAYLQSRRRRPGLRKRKKNGKG